MDKWVILQWEIEGNLFFISLAFMYVFNPAADICTATNIYNKPILANAK